MHLACSSKSTLFAHYCSDTAPSFPLWDTLFPVCDNVNATTAFLLKLAAPSAVVLHWGYFHFLSVNYLVLPVWNTQTRMEVKPASSAAARSRTNQLRKSEGLCAAFKRMFPRCCRSGWQKQKAELVVCHSICQHSPSLLWNLCWWCNLVVFFHAGNFPERVIHFSHPHLSDWPTFCQEQKQQFWTCADPHVTRQ